MHQQYNTVRNYAQMAATSLNCFEKRIKLAMPKSGVSFKKRANEGVTIFV